MRTWDIIGNRRWGYLLSAIVIIPGVVAIIAWGINFGIDFTGGTLLDLRLGRAASLEEVRAALPFGRDQATLQQSPDRPRQVLIRTEPLDEEQVARIRQTFAQRFGGVEVLRAERVGPKIGAELRRQAIAAVIVGLLLQIVYISWRFRSIRFALAADIALIHDLVIVVGIFALTRKQVDSSFVAVLLTVVGYSVNDTVVILDRIRESLNMRSREPFPRLVNRSILEVLVRSLTTGFGAILALLIIYSFGGSTIRDFVLGLGIGVITGTYSSIFIASPVLVEWHNWSERRQGREGAEPREPQPRETTPRGAQRKLAPGESGGRAAQAPEVDGSAPAARETTTVGGRPAGTPRRRRSRRR